MNKKLLLSLTLLIFVLSCQSNKATPARWQVVYKNSKTGTTLSGSKKELINAIRQGHPVRIAWGAQGQNHSIEHIGEPIWLAILDETEVIAHLDPQVLSNTDWQALTANYADSTLLKQEWRVVLTTKGEFDAVWYDRASNEPIKRVPQQHAISWFVQSSYQPKTKAKAFFKE